MSRSYAQRRMDRITRLRERMTFLQERIEKGCSRSFRADRSEWSALVWVLEELDRFNAVEDAMREDSLTEFAKLVAISSIVNARHRPSDADIRRTKQLAHAYGWKVQRPEPYLPDAPKDRTR